VKEKEAVALLIKTGCSSSVIEHSRTVAEYARKIALDIYYCARKRGGAINIDMDCIIIGGLLHDIGKN
jgi:putative nucleotidyltransferase with HDIG domain